MEGEIHESSGSHTLEGSTLRQREFSSEPGVRGYIAWCQLIGHLTPLGSIKKWAKRGLLQTSRHMTKHRVGFGPSGYLPSAWIFEQLKPSDFIANFTPILSRAHGSVCYNCIGSHHKSDTYIEYSLVLRTKGDQKAKNIQYTDISGLIWFNGTTPVKSF